MSHLSDHQLDSLRLEIGVGAEAEALEAHLAECEACAARAEALRAAAEAFSEANPVPDLGELTSAARARGSDSQVHGDQWPSPPSKTLRRIVLPLIAAAAVWLMVAWPEPEPSGIRAKGGGTLEVFEVRGGEPHAVERVPGAATLRLRYAAEGHARVLWRSAEGVVAIHPPEPSPSLTASGWVPREVKLEAGAGPEEVILVTCPESFGHDEAVKRLETDAADDGGDCVVTRRSLR